MAPKVPAPHNNKKAGKSLKEKRSAKRAKNEAKKIGGSDR
jgi:hypothetical protein